LIASPNTLPSETFGTAALAVNTWTHLALTYDGANMRLYVNGTLASTKAQTGAIRTSTNALQIGGDTIFGQYFSGLIDEVRIYNGALTAAQVQTDMSTPLPTAPPDLQPPGMPGTLSVSTVGTNQIDLTWGPATDNVGVTGYRVERQDPGGANFVEIGTTSGTTFSNTGLAAGTTYNYRVRATDAAGNLGPYSNIAVATTSVSQAAGLVAAYSFNEGTGSIAVDSSGNGNSGTLGGATWVTSGKYTNALVFNGAGSIVTVADSPSLDLTTGMTLEAWVNPSTRGDFWRDVVYKGDNDIYYLEGTAPNVIGPGTGGTFSSAPLNAPTPIPLNAWSHLAATYDGTTLRMYVNGVQVASRAQTGPINKSSGPLTIGGDSLYGQYWNGLIDEVRVYNRALSAAEIATDMNTAIAGGDVDSIPPTVSIDSPSAGATESHVEVISATAADNKGVASVEFFADGNSIGIDTQAPYSISWNTTTLANGTHTLTAVAEDLAGNRTQSAPVTVNTLNPAFVNEDIVTGITYATTIAFLPDGRMLIGELTNNIRILQPGSSQPDQLLNLNYAYLFGEQGLMDIAVDPNFATNGYVYVFYTHGYVGSHNRDTLSRFTMSGNTVVDGSEFVLWQDDVDSNSEHHGGSIAFGPDGKLYFTTGEHFDPPKSQDLTSYHGKLLRINLDGTIPTDNPFYDGDGPNKDAIYAYGLRNPYRISTDPVTGRMYIGDVGGNDPQTAIEEVDLVARGANYGWPLEEGNGGVPGTTPPIYSYPHNGRDACITGGFVYRGNQFPSEYYGNYFFGDFVQNTMSRLTLDAAGNVTNAVNFLPADGSTDGPTVGDPVKFVQGPDGSIYYVDIGFNDQHTPNDAAIRRIRYVPANQPPVAASGANPTAGLPPLTVAFSSAGSSDPEGATLSYTWNFGDGTTSTQANPTHTYQVAGPYIVKLTVSDGVNSTPAADLQITVGTPPVPTITSPTSGSFFKAGDVITFSGTGTDREDGALPASAFTWTILFHHEDHVHPGGVQTGTTTGTLTIPTSGHDFQGRTSYEIVLTVTDSSGLSASTSVTIYPSKVNLSFDTLPSGLNVAVDGIVKQTPFVLDDIIGFQHTISASTQTSGGTTYAFAGWSDGGAQSHSIVVPTTNQSYVATFQPVTSQPPGLVAAYSFNEGSGASVTDTSGNGNTGTLNGPGWSTAGKFGNALSFNGGGSLVSVNDSQSLDLSTGMTLEAWVNPSNVDFAWRDVIYKGTNDIYYLEGTSPQGQVPGTGGKFSPSPLYGTSVLPVNTWSHLASTFDGSMLRLYVNGVQVASRAQSTPIQASTGALTIGGDGLFGQYWIGKIDEVRIYNRALAASEIQSDMVTPIGSSLQLAGKEVTSSKAPRLTAAQLKPILAEAVARWESIIVSPEAKRRLDAVRLDIADLPKNTLGMSSGNVVFIDINAAGHGWFVDQTPWEDSEFVSSLKKSPAKDRVDLLSVVEHELGHILGFSDNYFGNPYMGDCMADTLPIGMRHRLLRRH
jgi:glucose/arabinose dehydrogenase